jgi:hypothetical protein
MSEFLWHHAKVPRGPKADISTVMIAETISLGILSLPSVLATVGLVPGFLLILGLGIIATYSGYVIGQFKERYPWVVIPIFAPATS